MASKSCDEPETQVKATCTSDPNIPPKESCREQFLFLLELYVRCVQSPRLTKLNNMFYVPTSVGFCFLDFKPDDEMQITPVDPVFEPLAGIGDDTELFFSGRSVLFGLSQEAVADTCKDFKIYLRVCKKMPKDIRPDVLVGTAKFDMTMQFAALRKELIDANKYQCSGSAIPNPSKTFDELIPLCFEERGCGSLDVYARVSAYGQTIVTEFEAPDIERESATSFLFKATDQNCEEKPLCYKCRALDPSRCDFSEILSETDSAQDCHLCKPKKLPCAPCRIGSGAILIHKPPPTPQKDCCSPKPKCPQPSPPSPPPPPVKKAPSGCGKGEPESSCVSSSCALPHMGIQSSRGPKEPCGKAVVLKVSGLLDACPEGEPQQACVTVVPESEATDPKDIENDPEHDVFILRIGKKGLVGAGEKSDIQLEMRTPKGPDRRPPLRLETREIQTEDNGGKKGKGKKKK